MNTLKPYLYKEIMEGIRTKKFLIIAIGFMFFAVADPVLLKLTPEILKSQMKGVDFSSAIELTQKAAILNFTNDLYQLVSLIIALTLMGIISSEINEKSFVIPFSIGGKASGIILSKFFVYSVFVVILTVISISTAYWYSGIIFKNSSVDYIMVLKAGFLYGLFFIFLLSIIILFSSLFKKNIITAIASVIIIYTMPITNSLFTFGKYLPINLLKMAENFKYTISKNDIISILVSLILIIVFNVIAYKKLSTTEL